jgi:site-specific recombinase XerD
VAITNYKSQARYKATTLMTLEKSEHLGLKEKEKLPIVYRVTAAGLSPDTRMHYQRDINRFLAHFKITDIEPLKERSLQFCKQMIIDYVKYLRDQYHKEKSLSSPLSRNSIKLHLSAIRYFFFMIRDDEFPINWTKINVELPPNEFTHRDRGYTVEEIQKMLEVGCQSRLREKVVILLLTSAGGMRIGGIPKLKKGDLKTMYSQGGEKVYGIRVYSDSSQDYFTPCSPECTTAIDRYLEERINAGEAVKNESPLIRNLYNFLSVKVVKPLSIEGVKYLVRKAVKLSGVKNKFEFKGEVKMSRGFRKFYKSEADLSGMIPATVELTQGHSIGIPGHYLRIKESDILQDYEKVIDRVTIDGAHRLKKQVDKLETSQAQEITRIKTEVQSMQEFLQRRKEREAELVQQGFETWLEFTLRDFKLQPLTVAEKQAREGCKTFEDLLRVGQAEIEAAPEAKLQQRRNQRWVEVGLGEESDCGYLDDDDNDSSNSDGKKSRLSLRFNS